jgi:HK97 family phage major capsid protein
MSTMTTSDLRRFINQELDGSVREVVERELRKVAEGRGGQTRELISRMVGDGAGEIPSRDGSRGVGLAQMLRAVAASKGDPQRASEWARKAGCLESVVRALGATDGSAGGFLVPVQFSQDVIEFLRPMSAVRRLNPNVVSMPSGTTKIPKITTGASASYIGESVNIPMSQPVFGQVILSFKKLAALVPISNDLIRYSSPSVDSVVRDDVVRAMAQRENQAFLRDTGTENTPRGLRFAVASANVSAMTGADNLADIVTNLGRLVLALENNNIPMTRPGWIFGPRTKFRLMTLLNAVSSAYMFRAEMLNGTLWGYPYATSTAVPQNLGAAANESEVYLADFADVVIGESQSLIVDSSTEASYWDGTAQQSAYSRDETVVRCILEEDLVMRRAESGAVLIGVTWGV